MCLGRGLRNKPPPSFESFAFKFWSVLGWGLQWEGLKVGQDAHQTEREHAESVSVCAWLCSTARSDATGKRSGRAAGQPRASCRDSSAAQHNVPVLVRNVATRDPQMTHVDRGNSPVCGSPPRPFLNRTCMFFKAACASLGKKTALGTNTQDDRAYMYYTVATRVASTCSIYREFTYSSIPYR